MHEPRYYTQLRNRIFLIIVSTSLIPVIFIAMVTGYMFHTSYKAKIVGYLSELIQKHAQSIDSFLANSVSTVTMITLSNDAKKLQDPDHLSNIISVLQTSHGGVFVDIGFIREDGIQVAYAGPFKLGMAFYGNSEWFREAIKNPYSISDVFLGLRGLPHFVIAVRLEDEDRIWVLRSTIDFAYFTKIVENIKIGETGEAFILSKDGNLQTSLNSPYSKDLLKSIATVVFSDSLGREREGYPIGDIYHTNPKHSYDKPVTLETRKTTYVFKKEDASGRSIIYVAVPLRMNNWALVYRQWDSEVFMDIYKARSIVFSVIVISIFLLTGLGWRLSNRVVERIKQVDREKDAMNDQIIEAGKLAALGELAAGIAHEINNPVAIMVEEAGWIEDCLRDLPDKEMEIYKEIAKSAKQIKTQGARCREITHKLLTFARRSDTLERRVFLNTLLNEIAILCEQRARYAKVKIEKKFDEEIPAVAISPTEMQQVILNLINNAIDAMETQCGGVLTLSTKFINDWVVLEVSDTGPGIPKSILPRIFDPFFTTKPVGKGTGLGLSICYGIIKKAGGNIEVESEVGKGTTFRIWLPPVQPPNSLIVGASPEDLSSIKMRN
ncbi:MAG: ATP-binding protein [Syntrophobacterales bacterium]|nr:ATP-binding protein [Syntrophobacterales bacterium]